MYNETIKRKFLDEESNGKPNKIAEATFEASETYENRYQTDICAMNKEQLRETLDGLCGLRYKSKYPRMLVLRKYSQWCVENGIEGANDNVSQVYDEDFGKSKIKEQTVANPKHLQRYLDSIFRSDDDGTVECIYRCYCWLAYAGMEERYVTEIRSDNVNLSQMAIYYKGNEYPIYRESLKTINNCLNLREFNYYHPNYGSVIVRERGSGDQLLRGYTERTSVRSLRVELSRSVKRHYENAANTDESLKLRLSYYRLMLSGMFYRAYENELAGIEPNFMKEAASFMKGKTYQLDKGRNLIGAKQRQLASDYLTDYKRWKEVYKI